MSIIIPVYNVEHYILRCLKSVAAQTYKEGVECIIVDDCGGDNSMSIAESFVESYMGKIKFIIIHNEHNKGLSGARNVGIKEAHGKYLYFLDSDDEIKEDCLAGFLQIVETYPDVDLVQGLYEGEGNYLKQFLSKNIPTYCKGKRLTKLMLLDYDAIPVMAHNKLVRADIIKENSIYFKEGIIHEDNYWSYFLAKHVNIFALYRNKCYIYYTNPGSIMTAPKWNKEKLSYQVMLKDFSANIDPFMKGEQKRAIFLVLQAILDNKYYESEEERQSLVKCFAAKNNAIERLLLKLCLRCSPTSTMRSNIVRMLIRLYRLEDSL